MIHVVNLIAELCPEGVPFEPLRDVGTWYGGGTPSKSRSEYWQDGTVPWLSPKDMTRGTLAATEDRIATSALNSSAVKLVPAGSVAFVVRSNILRRHLPVALVPFATTLNQDVRAVVPRKGVLPEYLAQVCRARAGAILSAAGRTDGSMAAVSGPALLDFRVPIPPPEIQRQIIQTLKPFEELEVLVSMEREARKVQRAELARRLITTSVSRGISGTQRVRLGDIASQFRVSVRVNADTTYASLGVKWYGEGAFVREPRIGASIKSSTLYGVKSGQLIYNRMFVSEGSFALIGEDLGHGVVSNEFPVYDLDRSRVVPDWLLLYLLDEYSLKRIEAETTGTERGTMKSRRRWKEQQFEAFEIDLPPLEDQRRAAHAISVAKDLESALRDEGVARRQQYEYYRDKLLTFSERSDAA